MGLAIFHGLLPRAADQDTCELGFGVQVNGATCKAASSDQDQEKKDP
jgi:hypothetical protein